MNLFNFIDKLNEKQRLAVETIDGPVMVVAGPGTGKTQVLAMRIAYILENTDTPPDAILALTFSDSGRQAMRKRLVEIIGSIGYYVRIETFHSFCDSVIKSNPEIFAISSSEYTVLDELERHLFINQILNNGKYHKLRPIKNPDAYVKEISRAISDLKKEGISPKDFLTKINQVNFDKLEHKEKLIELADLFQEFSELLEKSQKYDFDDMVTSVVTAFESNSGLLKSYQEQLLYLLADEYQDTNSSQNQVLFKLSEFWGDKANLFVVGDPDQSIYRFQGASLENTLEFRKRFPNALTIFLNQNYRSQQMILDASSSVIKNNELRSELIVGDDWELSADTTKLANKIQIAHLANDPAEKSYIVYKIRKLVASGITPSEIAVIYRTNADGREIARLLDVAEIPYEFSDRNITNNLAVSYLLVILQAINSSQKEYIDNNLFKCLALPTWDHDLIELVKINREAHKARTELHIAIEKSTDLLLKHNLRMLDNWSIREKQIPLPMFILEVMNQSGLISWIEKQSNPLEFLSAIRSFVKFINSKYESNHNLNLDQLIEIWNLYQKFNLSLPPVDLASPKNSVQLLTAHKSKGLEFENVFIMKAIDGVWGGRKNKDVIKLPEELLKNPVSKSEKNEDERRLFYVAMTRAKQNLWITMADEYNEKISVPTIFATEIDSNLAEDEEIEEFEELTLESNFHKQWLTIPSNEIYKENLFLEEIVKNEFVMSYSAFESYRKCPHQFKLKYLWKIPQETNEAMLFGTIMHRILELYFKNKFDLRVDKEKLLRLIPEVIEQVVPRHPHKQQWIIQAEDIVKVAIVGYLPEISHPVKTEWFVGGINNPIVWEGVKIQGKIDRVDWVDQRLSQIRIVDYKTTQAKSRNALLGETQDQDAPAYLDQMKFYSLIINADKRNIYKPKEMELCFLSPTKTKNPTIKYERFEIEEDEKMKVLKEQILEVWNGIQRLEFDHKEGCECEN